MIEISAIMGSMSTFDCIGSIAITHKLIYYTVNFLSTELSLQMSFL